MAISVDRLWKDVQANIRARGSDYLLPAAAFLFLPPFALTLLAPDLVVLGELESIWDVPAEYALTSIVVGFIGLLATIAIIAMSLDPRLSQAAALRLAGRKLLPAILLNLIVSAAVLLGLLALIIPGFIALARLWAALPVLVTEDAGDLEAVKRSWALSDGSTLRILFVLLMVGLGLAFVGFAAGAVALLDTIFGLGDAAAGDPGLFAALGSGLVSAIVGIYVAVIQARVYAALVEER